MNDLINNIAVKVQSIEPFWFILISLALFGSVIYLIISVFKDLRVARIIKNTPTSKIRSAAQGYVELQGKASSLYKEHIAPLTKKSCCWYKYLVEKEVTNTDDDGNTTTKWELVDKGESHGVFKINDETGECLINLFHADVKPAKYDSWIGVALSNIESHDIKSSDSKFQSLFNKISLFNNERYKYTEYRIEPEDQVYTLGFFQTFDNTYNPFRSKESNEIKFINTNLKSIFTLNQENINIEVNDINNSIQTVKQDWDYYINSLPENIRINYLSHRKDPCIISTYSQKKLIAKYHAGSLISAFGCAIAVILLTIFLYLRTI